MAQLEDSIVLILSSDVKNTAFGTGFIIAHDQNYSYLLTCAHVLEQINGKNSTENKLQISGVNIPVEIVECGTSDGIDIALLKVAGLFDNSRCLSNLCWDKKKLILKLLAIVCLIPKMDSVSSEN